MTFKHIWNFLCFLTTASAVIVLSPSINSTETLMCHCPDHQCQQVHWYRLLHGSDTPEFIAFINNIFKDNYASNIDQNRFKTIAKDSTKLIYELRISGIQKQDAGFYSCLLSSQNSAQDPKDLMPVGYSIWPESITTQAPTTVKKTIRLRNKCKTINQSPKGCKSLVLWSGVGIALLLVVVLIATLYYFSRLPKKCRHHFVKKRQLS